MIRALLVALFLLLPHSDNSLLELWRGEKLRKPNSAAPEIKIISYNIRWRSGDDLNLLIKFLK